MSKIHTALNERLAEILDDNLDYDLAKYVYELLISMIEEYGKTGLPFLESEPEPTEPANCCQILIEKQAEIDRLTEAIYEVCELIRNEGSVSKWKIMNRLGLNKPRKPPRLGAEVNQS
jgi:hypothetical protein